MSCKSTLLLPLVALAVGAHAQLATKVSSSASYEKLFTDGTTLYEVHGDTLGSINTATGARSFIDKLPAPPSGNYLVRWASPFATKVPGGFVIAQDLQDQSSGFARTVRVWSNVGGSWDTLAVTKGTFGPSELFQLGSKYALYVPGASGSGQLLRTDGTKAGTSVVASVPSFYSLNPTMFKRGTTRMFFNANLAPSIPSTYPLKLYALDDNSLTALDSASNTCLPLAALGDDCYYDYKHQSGPVGTPGLITTHALRKWTAGAGVATVAAGLNGLSSYFDGLAFQGKIIAQVLDSGSQSPNLVAIDPATGTPTYLTANPKTSTYPNYFLHQAGVGSAHLYVQQLESSGWSTVVTDGTSATATKKIFTSRNGPSFAFVRPGAYGPANAIICGDDVYGQQYKASGTFNVQLFKLAATAAVDSQDLNTATVGGSSPSFFVKVGGEILFTAAGTTPQGYASTQLDLWKITACSSVTPPPSNGIALVPAGARIALYPNPASDAVQVFVNETLKDAHLALFDATGRNVLQAAVQNGQTLSVATLPAGLYQWRVSGTGMTVQTGRLAIVH